MPDDPQTGAREASDPAARVPVTLLTGFLGAGKTTLLNAWLTSPLLADAAVIVNEFGDIGIDHELIQSSNENTIELSSGCLCCTVKGDLVETLRDLAERRRDGDVRRFSNVLIETSGLADPAPIVQALMSFPVASAYRFARLITAVDAVNGAASLERYEEARRQAAMADVLVLTKSDLGADGANLKQTLQKLNPSADVFESRPETLPPPDLVGGPDIHSSELNADDAERWLGRLPDGDGNECADAHHGADHSHHDHNDGDRHHKHGHSEKFETFSFRFDEPLEWEHVATWLDALVIAHGDDLLRVKGIIDIIGQDAPIVVHAVQRLFHPPAKLAAWPAGRRESRIVFITRNLKRSFVEEVFAVIRTKKLRPSSDAD